VMNIAVIGCGSVGGVIAARLLNAGKHQIFIIDFDEKIQKTVAENGLVIKVGKKATKQSANILGDPAQMTEKADLVIITTKAYSVLKAALSLLPYMKDDAGFITVQNGLVGLNLAHELGAERVTQSAVLWGASMKKDPLEYEITALGSFMIGTLSQIPFKTLELVQSVLSSVFPVYISSNIAGVLWSKMCITCSLTSLGAITGLGFGKMIRHRKIRTLILGIGREVLAIARAQGVTLESLGEKLDVECLLDDDGFPMWRKHLNIRLIGFHHRNTKSSMLADIKGGKKTEIEFLNGLIQRYAQEKSIDAPLNAKVVELVARLESGSLRPSSDNIKHFKGLEFS
jgi:2-dehydropantoate 2-reductase